MKALVTGGAGFIGSALIRHLVGKRGALVLNIDKLTYAAEPRSLVPVEGNEHYAFVQADINDRDAMDEAFATFQPDTVFHLAAESHVDRSITGSADFIQTNINGTHTLLEAARQYWQSSPARDAFRFVHVSTDEVYGSLGAEGLFHEHTAYDPSSPYSASKAASDHLVMAWHRTYGFPSLISNCSNNYGPCQFPEKLIPLMILNALEGEKLPIYGDGMNVRDWLYVEDHARALCLIAVNGRTGETYNIGGRNERTNLAVAETICTLMDERQKQGVPHNKLISFVADRPGHDQRYAIDATKIKSELGWRAEEDFESGLAKTVGWYLANTEWWKPLRKRVYGGERLGLVEENQLAAHTG